MADIELLLKYLAAPAVTAGLGYLVGLNKSKQDFALKIKEKELDRRHSIEKDFVNKKRRIEGDLLECEKYYINLATVSNGLLKFINSDSNMTKKLDISEYMAEINRFEGLGRSKSESAFRGSFDLDAINHKVLKDLSDKSLESISRAYGLLLDLSINVKSSCMGLESLIENWPEGEYVIRWEQFIQQLKVLTEALTSLDKIIKMCREMLDKREDLILIYAKI